MAPLLSGRSWIVAQSHRLAIFLGVSLIAACAAPPQQRLSTPSGNPETIFPNTTRKAVIDQIVASKLEKGMQVKTVSDYSVVVGKKVDNNFMASFLYGSRYDSTPEVRLTYNVVEVAGGVRVFSRMEIVTNPGSAFERVSDLTSQYAAQLQAELEPSRASVDSKLERNPGVAPASLVASPSATPAAVVQTAAPTEKPAKNTEPPLKEGFVAERFAKNAGCADIRATFIGRGPGYESYSFRCTNGDTLVVQCEMGNCRALK